MKDEDLLALMREAMIAIEVPGAEARAGLALDDTLADLGIDSVLALELAAFIEERLALRFPDDELSGLVDVRGIAGLVRRHLGVPA